MSAELIELVRNLGQPRVLVVGDLMLDRYVWGDAERISQEAPVILLRADRREERLGGASSVATMLRALGAKPAIAGVVGADADGGRIRQLLLDHGIRDEAVLIDAGRPSTVKERYIGRAQHRHPQQMIRVDFEDRKPLSLATERELLQVVGRQMRNTDVVLVSDYDKGVCTPTLLASVISAARACGVKVVADPVRGGDYRKYHGCSAITPNRLEAGLAAGRVLNDAAAALEAAAELRERLDLEAAIVTLDKEGMALAHADGRREVFPTRPRQVYDITGAGDMVMAVLGMALAAGADYGDAIRLANVAGGLEVEKVGVAVVTREEIVRDLLHSGEQGESGLEKVREREALVREVEARRAQGQRVAFTNGCFDLLHAGHVQYLQEARAQADLLVVGLNADAGVRALKGPGRPVNPVESRALVLAGLEAVDYLTVFDEPTPLELIRAVRPDVLVKGADYTREEVAGADFVESYGGRVHLAGLRAGHSTTKMLQRLATLRGTEMNIAVFLPNWIGDAVMATPAVRALREHYRGARMTAVVRPYVAGVFGGCDWFDNVVFLRGKSWQDGTANAALKLRKASVDLAVLFPNSFRSALTAWLGACKRRVGYARYGRSALLTDTLNPVRDAAGKLTPSPILDAYNLLAVRAGCPDPGRAMTLLTAAEDEADAGRVWDGARLHRYREVICLNPGAAFGSAKHWPAEYFAALARDLAEKRGAGVLVLCGPAERPLSKEIAAKAKHPAVHALGDQAMPVRPDGPPLSLGLTKACVRRADLLVTTDSGPRHFAAAFGRPVVTLFGPTFVAWTETFYPRAVHLQKQVDCGPCQRRVCPLDHRCMKQLLPAEVFAAAEGLLRLGKSA